MGRGLRAGAAQLDRADRCVERAGGAEAVRRRPERFGRRTELRWRRSDRTR